MMDFQNRSLERETIAPRTITLQLSTADVQRLSEKAISAGFTITQLLENFVGDLVDGTHTNGSDERYYAGYWYDRCGFEYTARKSFLRFLVNESTPEYVVDLWNDHQDAKSIFEDEADDITPKDRQDARAIMEECMSDMAASYADYQSWAGPEAATLEVELAEVLRWKSDLDCLIHPSSQSNQPTTAEALSVERIRAELGIPSPQNEAPHRDLEWEP